MRLTQSLLKIVKKDAYVVSTVAAESKTGKLTGASDLFYGETVSIDGTKYQCELAASFLAANDAMNIKNNGETGYTFYFDSYGNVIGRTDKATTESELRCYEQGLWLTSTEGVFTIKAEPV